MEHTTVGDLVNAVRGTLTAGAPDQMISHISLDSRKMQGDDLFVPIIGEKHDAHDYIDTALNNGAKAVLYSKNIPVNERGAFIKVEDTRKALQDIGAWYRDRLALPVVGITGSVGKTTTKEMIAAGLSEDCRVYKTAGNLNSQVGVPVSVSGISFTDQIAVLELGMSEFGEMERIARVAKPTVAVITNIGVTHIEQLGSRENILREKWHITDYLKPGDSVIVCGDNDMLSGLGDLGSGLRIITYGLKEYNQVRAYHIRKENGETFFDADVMGEKIPIRLRVRGQHMILNALAALAVSHRLHTSLLSTAQGLYRYQGASGRQQVDKVKGFTIIDDSYNASPDSMKAALLVLTEYQKEMAQGGRTVAVLGDMKELGGQAEALHLELGSFIAGLPIDEVVTVGELAHNIAWGLLEADNKRKVREFKYNGQAAHYLKSVIRPRDVILFKGSNSMRLFDIVKELKG